MLTLYESKVKKAVDSYTKEHGGNFFYEEPGNVVMYENRNGDCFSFDNSITDEEFIKLLASNSLNLLPVETNGEAVY